MIDLETLCTFCDEEATTKYQAVYFCRDHLIVFWFGLRYTGWTD